jgi:hypothetical protein
MGIAGRGRTRTTPRKLEHYRRSGRPVGETSRIPRNTRPLIDMGQVVCGALSDSLSTRTRIGRKPQSRKNTMPGQVRRLVTAPACMIDSSRQFGVLHRQNR